MSKHHRVGWQILVCILSWGLLVSDVAGQDEPEPASDGGAAIGGETFDDGAPLGSSADSGQALTTPRSADMTPTPPQPNAGQQTDAPNSGEASDPNLEHIRYGLWYNRSTGEYHRAAEDGNSPGERVTQPEAEQIALQSGDWHKDVHEGRVYLAENGINGPVEYYNWPNGDTFDGRRIVRADGTTSPP